MKTIAQQINWDFEKNGVLKIQNKNFQFLYYELPNGWWAKTEYDLNGNELYHNDSNGFWVKREYDSQGNQIYYESSNGTIIDKRPKPCSDKEIVIEGVKYKLVKA